MLKFHFSNNKSSYMLRLQQKFGSRVALTLFSLGGGGGGGGTLYPRWL